MTVGRDHLTDHLVVRLGLLDGIPHVGQELVAALGVTANANHVGEKYRPAIRKAFVREQRVHQFDPPVSFRRLNVGLDLFHARDATDEIDVHAAEIGQVVYFLCNREITPFVLEVDQGVDLGGQIVYRSRSVVAHDAGQGLQIVAGELGLLALTGDQAFILGELGSVEDPLLHHEDLSPAQRLALGRHDVAVFVGERNQLEQRAFFRVSGNDNRAVFTPLLQG